MVEVTKDPRTESVLASLGVKFEHWPEYPISKLVSDEATQVRFEVNRAPKKEVERYRDLLKAGAVFPPVVVLKDGRLIDGNTRWGAYVQLKRPVISAYVCATTDFAVAKRIGVELNSQAGKRMEKQELANWLASGNGAVSDEDALRITGWNAKTVRTTRGALQFEGRRSTLGVPLNVSLPDDTKYRLTKANDPEVFRDLTKLAADAGLSGASLTSVVEEANELAKTDVTAARKSIADHRGELAQAIEERQAGLRATTPLLQQMRMHLGWAIKQGASGLHDTNEHTTDRSRQLLEDTLDVVKEALARY